MKDARASTGGVHVIVRSLCRDGFL